MNLKVVRKALVALGGAVIAVAAVVGTNIDPTAVTAVVGGITSVLVYLWPNAVA